MLSAALSSWGNLDPPYWYFCNLEQRTSGSEEGGSTLRVRVLEGRNEIGSSRRCLRTFVVVCALWYPGHRPPRYGQSDAG